MSTPQPETPQLPDLPLIIEDLLLEAERCALRGDPDHAIELRDTARQLRRDATASGNR